ncbi:MAG: outer membrane beta-barrel protein [Lewinellaceae bacterium]|nr:outer membrane beta-barrel protein [Lewinellaceae bacterium]
MKRPFLLIGALLLGTAVLAQAEFGWGVEVYPNYSGRRLVAQSTISREDINKLEALESGRLSYTAGLFAQWRGQRAGFQTGLRFMETGYQTIRTNLTADDNPPEGAEQKRDIYQNLNLEIPAELQFYQQLDDKNHFFFMIGLSLAYNISNYHNTAFYTGESRDVRREKEDNAAFNSILYSFQSGMGWEHRFSEGFSMVLQPAFQFWPTALLKENDINRNLYSFGLRLGAKWR